MNDKIEMTRPATALWNAFRHLGFGFLSSFVIRHLSFAYSGPWPRSTVARPPGLSTKRWVLRARVWCVALVLALAPVPERVWDLSADDGQKVQPAAESAEKVPLLIKLPAPAFKGTPKDLQLSSYVEPLSTKPRPPMMVPAGLTNIAPAAKITCSDKNATADALARITDGDKEASEPGIVVLRKGTQWVQLDFGSPQEIYALVIWHAHNAAKVYHDVIVQGSDDPDFFDQVQALFNNDQDNSSGLGAGTDREYFETHEGKLIDARGVKARYIRFYSKGSTESALNEYTEIEVYGRPVAATTGK